MQTFSRAVSLSGGASHSRGNLFQKACCAFYLLCNQAQLLLNRSSCFGEQQLETAGAVINGTQRLAQIVHQIRKHLFRLGQNQLAHGGARGDP